MRSKLGAICVTGCLILFGYGLVKQCQAEPLRLTLDTGAYYNLDFHPEDEHRWEDGGSPVATFRLRLGKDRFGCEYLHVSNWFTGAPFNDRNETTLNAVGCTYKVDIWRGR